MPGFLIQQGATVLCMHGGQAMPTAPNPRITLSGMPSAVISAPWTVAGCPGIPAAFIPPCVTAQWIVGTTRVTSNGQPLLALTGQATCMPTGTPLMPIMAQMRVTAT